MGFYKIDRVNDRRRNVSRKYSASFLNFWHNISAGQNFLISGGNTPERTYAALGAISNFVHNVGSPVIILHNDPVFANTIVSNLNKMHPGIMINNFTHQERRYLPLAEMDRTDVLECIKGQIGISQYTDRMGIELCASSYWSILERYDRRRSLSSLVDLCQLNNEALINMCRQVNLSQNVINGITANTNASAGFRNIIFSLNDSAKHVCSGNGRGQSISGCLKHYGSGQILLIEVGSSNSERLVACLADEIRMLQDNYPNTLVLVNDIPIRKNDRLHHLLESNGLLGHMTMGLCTTALEVMIPDPEVYNTIRGLVKRTALFHYTDGGMANRICNMFGNYEHLTKVDVVAPAGPFTIIRKKAPGHHKEIRPRIDPTELQEMHGTAVILHGHKASTIEFVRSSRL